MKRIGNRFWLTLEVNPSRAATLADWQRATGAEYGLFEKMFHPVEGLASIITDPENIDGRSLAVVDYGNGKYGAIDDNMTRRIPLTLGDIIRYALKLRDFRSLLAGVLGFEPVSDEIPPVSLKAMRFGMHRVKPGVEFPVYLILVRNSQFLQEQLLHLLISEKSSFFLMTATRKAWSHEIMQLVRDRKSQIVSLEECLLVENGIFAKSEAWDNAVDEFRLIHYPGNLASSPDYLLAKRGAWVFRFNSVESIADGNLIGPPFVHFLLQHPNEEFHVEKLWEIVMGAPSGVSTIHVEHAFADGGTEEPNSLFGEADDILDPEAKKAYEVRLRELIGERKAAEAGKDYSELDRINEEFEAIQRALLESGSRIRQPKKLGDPSIKIRDRIRKGIDTFIDQVGKNDSAGAKYLKNTIKKSMFMTYSPILELDWDFS